MQIKKLTKKLPRLYIDFKAIKKAIIGFGAIIVLHSAIGLSTFGMLQKAKDKLIELDVPEDTITEITNGQTDNIRIQSR